MRTSPASPRSQRLASRIVAVCLAWIFGAILLVASIHFILNWRAERRWQAYAEAARARGVKLYLDEFAPPKIPDEENFAALPMMRATMQPGAESPMALLSKNRPSFGDADLDLKKWQEYFKSSGFIAETSDSPPRDILTALDRFASEIQEWSQWKTRPRFSLPLAPDSDGNIQIPGLTLFVNAARIFELRAAAHLALNDTTAAFDDFESGFHAYYALSEYPTLISALIRIAALKTLIQTAGFGLMEHRWQPTELVNLDAKLATVRMWSDYRFSFESERGFVNTSFDRMVSLPALKRAKEISASSGILPDTTSISIATARLISDGQIRDNQLRSNQYFDELLSQVDERALRFDPDQSTPSDSDHLSDLEARWFCLFKNSGRVFAQVAKRFAVIETQLEQARLAIAIERFRIARGKIPESLAELVPDFIGEVPLDIYTHQPMIYRRKDAGGFLLYSVGPDRRDDGGKIDPKFSEVKQPDWVWPYSRD